MQLEFGGQRLTVAAGDFVIGSAPGAALLLTGAGVEPRHAIIHLLADGLVAIQPASATAPLVINGIRAGKDPTPLLHGDRVTIGGHEIRVVDPRLGGATQVLLGLNAGTREDDPFGRGPEAGHDWVGRLVSLNDGREYPLDTVPFVLGRDATAQVVIASPDSSRRHAEIVSRPDGDVVVDLSTNGTHVNGKPIPGRHRLKALDVIRIGAEEFRYYPAPKPEPAVSSGAQFRLGDTLIGMPSMPKLPAGAIPRPARSKPLAVLHGKNGSMKGHRLDVMTPVANVGRGDYSDLKVNDPSVSASHAKLQLREGIWTLRDLGSTNGTTVDGSGISGDFPLSPGATLVFGEMAFSFEPRDEGIELDSGTKVLEAPVIPHAPIPLAAAAPMIRPGEPAPVGVPDPFAAPPRRASAPRPALLTSPPPPKAGWGGKALLVVALVVVLALIGAAIHFWLRQ